MQPYTHNTVPTQFIQAGNTRYAYRRFGKTGQHLPLVFFQHFTGTLDNWDPAVLDLLSEEREVIIFNNKGIASTDGEPPHTIAEIAHDAIAFIDALGLKQIDLFGFSMGSFVAQQVAVNRPNLVRKIILVGSGPRGGVDLETFSPAVWALFDKPYAQPDELLLDTFFAPTDSSQAAGRLFLDRIRAREDRDAPISDKVIPAQLAAIGEWGKKQEGSFQYLEKITHPVLVVTGKEDIIFPTVNSYLLQQNLPDAQLLLYPDSNHGSHYQFHTHFVTQVKLFLNHGLHPEN
ncbi:Pimeloyl-ACP methyl ester carboxylesterase [Filimonas lacunae]|uniref:Pimeloyl-ACP methyl ester carboxylesterase n=1 Tax=Filimonas lacunae TaxID=477680 RepID=A0A173MBL4_9BACT|nr:alpha/beta hydrolase [Filimonas lacunae]BAV04900.1 hydrolase, alpha/beta fold family functionally coupled to phosphoribulokinase [Filimonas lacunae]SIT33833.1 Pimeloyl-ACP methyl ester carboxylesterase [Filimonas lacunae]